MNHVCGMDLSQSQFSMLPGKDTLYSIDFRLNGTHTPEDGNHTDTTSFHAILKNIAEITLLQLGQKNEEINNFQCFFANSSTNLL